MSCGCNEEKILIPASTLCSDVQSEGSPCSSQSGKFHDKTIEDFTVPGVGKIGNLHVCQAKLWGVGQYVGVVIGKSKYGFFRITEIGERVLKVLNGCEKANTFKSIAGNPEEGYVIPEGAVVFPAPPFGCSDYLKLQFIQLLEGEGHDAIIKILKESDEICFYATPEVEAEPSYKSSFLFGGTFVEGCLRKLKKIFTGNEGKTLCMPEAGSTNESDELFNDEVKMKYLAYFDEKGCLKKGKPAKCIVNNRKTFLPRMELLYNGKDVVLTQSWASLTAPTELITPCAQDSVWAELELSIGSENPGTNLTMGIYVNTSQQLIAYANDFSTYISRRLLIQVTPGGNLTLEGRVIAGEPVNVICKVFLVGYYA